MGVTPTKRILTKSFADAAQHSAIPTAHFLLTDGVPSDASEQDIGRLIKNRANPQQNPVTLISCTNVDSECKFGFFYHVTHAPWCEWRQNLYSIFHN